VHTNTTTLSHFFTLAFHTNFSRILHPGKMVPHFYVPQFPAVQTGAANSCLVFSGPAFLTVPYFHVSYFQSPQTDRYVNKKIQTKRVFSRMRRSVTAESIPTNFAHQLPGGHSNIFDMTSKLIEGFRRGEGAKMGLSH